MPKNLNCQNYRIKSKIKGNINWELHREHNDTKQVKVIQITIKKTDERNKITQINE